MHITEALAKFVIQLIADGRSLHTRAQYQRHISLLCRWCAETGHSAEIEDLTHENLAEFVATPMARLRSDGTPKMATTLNCLRSSVRAFCSHLHRAGYIRQDPARLMRRAICSSAPPRCMSVTECSRLFRAMSDDGGPTAQRDHVLFGLLLETGTRLASALALHSEDIDLDNGVLTLRTAKGGRQETVYLPARTRSRLRPYLQHSSAGPLFRIGPRQAARRLAMWADRAGIQGHIHPHTFRHSFATRLYQKTRDVLLVKEALRHRSITSTLVYCRADRERLRASL